MEKTYAQEIKAVCEDMLRQLGVPFHAAKFDENYYAYCCAAAKDRGFQLEGKGGILPWLYIGSQMITTAFPHLSAEKQLYMAIFSAAIAAMDDVLIDDVESLTRFSQRLMNKEKHGHPALDNYDLILRDTPKRFTPLATELILHTAQDFCAGLALENEVLGKPAPSSSAKAFPDFLRVLTGVSGVYAAAIFPDDIPPKCWIEAIPALVSFISYSNDVLSFYKEELVNETCNYVSIKAISTEKTKREALQRLADETVKAYNEVVGVLAPTPAALEAFKQFSTGFVHFHTSCRRYKLTDLWEMP